MSSAEVNPLVARAFAVAGPMPGMSVIGVLIVIRWSAVEAFEEEKLIKSLVLD